MVNSPFAGAILKVVASFDKHLPKVDPDDMLVKPLGSQNRDYHGLVLKLLQLHKKNPAKFDQAVDAIPHIITAGNLADVDRRGFMDMVSRNLVDVVAALYSLDLTGSLRYLGQKIALEIARLPFELHLATSLHLELCHASIGSLFYYTHLENLLSFVEQPIAFFKPLRLLMLLRQAASVSSKLENIVNFKILSKFGESDELPIVSATTSLASSMLFRSPISHVLPAAIDVTVKAMHADQLGLDLTPHCKPWVMLDTSGLEQDFLRQTGKLATVSSLGFFEVSYKQIIMKVSESFLMIVDNLNADKHMTWPDSSWQLLDRLEVERLLQLELLMVTVHPFDLE